MGVSYGCLGGLMGNVVGFYAIEPGIELPGHVVSQLRGAAYNVLESVMAKPNGFIAVGDDRVVHVGMRPYRVMFVPAEELVRPSWVALH